MNTCKFDDEVICRSLNTCGPECTQHPWHREYKQGLVRGSNGFNAHPDPTILKAPRST